MSEPSGNNPNALRHQFWSPTTAAQTEVSFMRIARRRAIVTGVAMVFSVIAAGFAAWRHIRLILAPRGFVAVAPSGWIYSGKAQDLKVTAVQEETIWKQIVEAHFTRTEKGQLPNLKYFSTADTAVAIDKLVAKSGRGAYAFTLTIVETRVNGRTIAEAESRFRGRLTIVEKNATASSEVYIAALFRRGPGTMENPTGWRLAGLQEISRQQFFSKERDAERRETMGSPPAANTPRS